MFSTKYINYELHLKAKETYRARELSTSRLSVASGAARIAFTPKYTVKVVAMGHAQIY